MEAEGILLINTWKFRKVSMWLAVLAGKTRGVTELRHVSSVCFFLDSTLWSEASVGSEVEKAKMSAMP